MDIDIDVGNRENLLPLIRHVPASIKNSRKHPSGIYVTHMPYDPAIGMASIDHVEAEQRGYVKLDILNVYVYDQIKDEDHLLSLMREPKWSLLEQKSIVTKLIHLNNSYHLLKQMPEPIDSITRLAMFLAVIRPAKKHLVGKTWKEINKTVWDKSEDGYVFRKSHAIAYAQLVAVHLNMIEDEHVVTF